MSSKNLATDCSQQFLKMYWFPNKHNLSICVLLFVKWPSHPSSSSLYG